MDDEETVLTSGGINLKCLDCGEEFRACYDASAYQSSVFCPKCHPKYNVPETEIYSFLIQNFPDIEIKQKDRKVLNGKELDLYIPSKNLAVEFNGWYWHSSNVCGTNKKISFQEN